MKSRVFGCPSCQQPFQVLAELAGQIVQCPSCAQSVEIPTSAFTDKFDANSSGFTNSTTHGPTGPELISCCNHCQCQFGITAEMFGTQVACPHCQQAVEIQNPEVDVSEINIDTTTKPGDSTATNQNEIRQKTPILADSRSPQKTAGRNSVAEISGEQSSESLLPPAVDRSDSNKSETDKIRARKNVNQLKKGKSSPTKPVENKAAIDTQPAPIAHLMPPRFDVADPTRIRVSVNSPHHKILLPDGAGGLKQVDERIVQVEHGGQKISLVALTPRQRMRRRLITNAIAILLGIAILAIAFSMLT